MYPLAKPLADIRKELQDLVLKNLPEAHKALRELLPENAAKQNSIINLQRRLKELNKEKIDNVIDAAEYSRQISKITIDTLEIISGLEESDFETAKGGKSKKAPVKEGAVLYQIPHRMPLLKPSICIIRVAVDADDLLEDIVLNDDVRVRPRVEVSEFMSAELIDAEGNVFKITPFNKDEQNVRDTGYTQWMFGVTPKIEGEHKLLVKVSLLEWDPKTKKYFPRDVSILETVTIVTETPAPSDNTEAPFQSSGERLVLGPDAGNTNKTNLLPSGSVRALALFLVFLVVGSSAAWAFTPAPVRDWYLVNLRDNPEAYQEYIDTYKDTKADNPRLEKAYYFKAKKTENLQDLRAYQENYKGGAYYTPVVQTIRNIELKTVKSIQEEPDIQKIRRYLNDFPDATRLTEVKAVADQQLPPEQKTEALPLIETAYVTTIQTEPTATKIEAYVRDFPQMDRLAAVVEATPPEILQTAQPAVDEAIISKTTNATTTAEIKDALNDLKAAGSSKAVEKVTVVLDQKPQTIQRQVIPVLQQVRETVNEREAAVSSVTEQTGAIHSSGSWNSDVVTNQSATNKPPETTSAQKEPEEKKDNTAATNPPLSGTAKGLEMVRVQGGTFAMGDQFDEGGNREKPVHNVTLSSFEIGKYEVTQALWYEIMVNRPSYHKNCNDCPVERISWDDVQYFLKKLNTKYPGKNYRLPTEAEWEYAARERGKKVRFGNGKDIADPDKINFNGDAFFKESYFLTGKNRNKTIPVGSLHSPNSLGLHDMSGNVAEWCSDWYGENYYAESEGKKNPAGPLSGYFRVMRGGSWNSLYPQACRVADRLSVSSDYSDSGIGFRLARTL